MFNKFFAVIALALVVVGPAQAPAQPPPARCRSELTGPTVELDKWFEGFGRIEHFPALPLKRGQYVLTIDDGPDAATTPLLLDILARNCVHATFFMVGRRALALQPLAQRIVDEGNGYGSHSQTHRDFAKMDDSKRFAEILEGANSVERAARGQSLPDSAVRMFRLPGSPGMVQVDKHPMMEFLQAHNFISAGRDASAEDWRNQPPEESLHRLLAKLPANGVILLHDGQSNTPHLLELLLAEFRTRGAKIVALQTKS